MRTVSFPVIAVANAIKLSIATSVAPITYSGVQLDGAVGAAVMSPPRSIAVTTAAHAGSYTLTGITITGTDQSGNVQTEVLTLTAVNGGETVVGTKAFKTVTSIAVLAMTDALGAFTFGTRDIFATPKRIRVGTTGALKVAYEDGTVDTIPAVLAGETLAISPNKIFGDASTTATNLTLIFDVK